MNSLVMKALAAISISIFSIQLIAAEISQAQIEQFKRLSPSQQQALASSMGIDLSIINNISGSKKIEQASPSLNELVPVRDAVTEVKDDLIFTDKRFMNNKDANRSLDDVQEQLPSSTLQFSEDKENAALKPFGYDLFAGEPSTFAPVTDVPIPFDYTLGPGDTLSIQLYGKETLSLSLTINRQGNIDIPKLGPINIAGQSFSDAKSLIQSIIKERKIGVKSSISMGELRSIRVFVLGEAYRAASYTLSSLSTVTQALYAAGGVNKIGSLRNIQVKRRGIVVAELDLYQLLLKGDTSGDINLMAGDVVFIPTIGKTAGVRGEVHRPAIYELKHEKTAAELLVLAGGVRATAYENIGKITRINNNGLRSVISINLSKNKSEIIHNGDVIEVASVLPTLKQSLLVKGHVVRPGVYGWANELKLSDILRNINDFKEQPDLEYILITRKDAITGKLTSFNVNFTNYIKTKNTADDFKLNAEDTIYVFNKENNRSESLTPLLKTLRAQTELTDFADIVNIKGAVRNPGEYPLAQGAKVVDLLNAGMGYTQHSELKFALLARKSQKLETFVSYIDLTKDSAKNILLSPLDTLYLFDKNESRVELLEELIADLRHQSNKSVRENVVIISGDVNYPGQYPYVDNMNSQELVNLAGGLKESSYLLNADLVRFSHDGEKSAEVTHQNIQLNSEFLLQPSDTLHIKRIPDWHEERKVKLAGEFVFPGIYTLRKGETLSNVITRAGGLTVEADPTAALFTREALKKKEAQQIAHLTEQLENETAQLSLMGTESVSTPKLAESEELLQKLSSTEAVGRLVIDLPSVLANSQKQDIRLDDGDALYIPKIQESVSVIGEVQYATSHRYTGKFDIDDYIERSGGLRTRADQERIYIIKADGSVRLANNDDWFSSENSQLSPGDTVVVPLDLEYKDGLTLWSAVTQIIYNSAVAVAAIGSL